MIVEEKDRVFNVLGSQVRCSAEEAKESEEVVELVKDKVQEFRQKLGRRVPDEQGLAILIALELGKEVLSLRKRYCRLIQEVEHKTSAVIDKVDRFLESS